MFIVGKYDTGWQTSTLSNMIQVIVAKYDTVSVKGLYNRSFVIQDKYDRLAKCDSPRCMTVITVKLLQ